MTVRQFISDITNNVKALSIDSFLPPKLIHSKTKSIIANFLKKDVNANRMLYKVVEGWVEIEALQMEEVPVTTCDLDTRICQKLMKSTLKLPAIYSSKFGPMIKQAMSINFGNQYSFIGSPSQWKSIQKRKYQDPDKKYFFFIGDYIYIPIKNAAEPSPEVIRLEIYPQDMFEVNEFKKKINTSNCKDCSNQVDNCPKLLDYELVIPYFLEDDVKKEVVNQLAQVNLKVRTDDSPNLASNKITNPTNIG